MSNKQHYDPVATADGFSGSSTTRNEMNRGMTFRLCDKCDLVEQRRQQHSASCLTVGVTQRLARFNATPTGRMLEGGTDMETLGQPIGADLFEADFDNSMIQTVACSTSGTHWQCSNSGLHVDEQPINLSAQNLACHGMVRAGAPGSPGSGWAGIESSA